jgi:hypothetical protein
MNNGLDIVCKFGGIVNIRACSPSTLQTPEDATAPSLGVLVLPKVPDKNVYFLLMNDINLVVAWIMGPCIFFVVVLGVLFFVRFYSDFPHQNASKKSHS